MEDNASYRKGGEQSLIIDTISAIATPQGKGGVGIVRISGNKALSIAQKLSSRDLSTPLPRFAYYTGFTDSKAEILDEGLILYFKAPSSFTGEDVIELQAHGGVVLLDMLLARTLELGARLARPGEFTERAFLNNKLDLSQAEAILDLIESTTAVGARMAARTLRGGFSKRIHQIVESLISIRVFVESAIDFPDEEIDFLSTAEIVDRLSKLQNQFELLVAKARVGAIMRDGLTLVIAGRPNAGKSSLLNSLTGEDRAIVTEIPGTTRDLLRERIELDGIPLHIIDTAGLRDSCDSIEQEGIRRARAAMETADHILLIIDDAMESLPALAGFGLPEKIPFTVIRNKIDLSGRKPGIRDAGDFAEIAISAITGDGVEDLKKHIKHCAGMTETQEGEFIARRRHLNALQRAGVHLETALHIFHQTAGYELVSEELRQAQNCLGEITGTFTNEDLLMEIFAGFCIGK
ncbi:MAG: tRNA uridine-5-carboxymethylaminomethyl(34) synthesis GTPase MnmE [Gammaproteobacteria bacterium]|nr:tRNA uridine-5-carboxymethylaminomethyl(34) synthesis GTPase MnmE [Gammaproteobacteria bacterium]MBU1656023.1 tRNA uridine-5-carboxymethylaminomethyl(34) synthesis GTPase MnmE [Gammaproteobacteria bacterium]MBU1962231.1 tRNA uridine-5-carboxymethylaminomethyl(34) synthesis GTPase MnmE [Gammaproteobacteria bacterium]